MSSGRADTPPTARRRHLRRRLRGRGGRHREACRARPRLDDVRDDRTGGNGGHDLPSRAHRHPVPTAGGARCTRCPPSIVSTSSRALASTRRCGGRRAELEALIQVPVTSFAYPHGSYDRRVRGAVIAAGYAAATAVKNALSHSADDPFAIARWTVTSGHLATAHRRDTRGPGRAAGLEAERVRTRAGRAARRLRRRAARDARAALR